MSLCNCRLCSYDREFAEHLARIPESERGFVEELKSRWEHADADAEWYRALAIDDRNPTGGDVKQAPSRSDESGGAEGNRPNSVGHLLHKRSD